MRHRIPNALTTAVLALALALSACASDGDDDATAPDTTADATLDTTPAVETTATDGGADSTDATATTTVELTLADVAPAGADIVIEADGTTEDRPIQRGGQQAVEQGQTFAVDVDTSLTEVSFHLSAPAGVAAGQTVELAVYEVGNTVTMMPSGPVDIGTGSERVAMTLPDAIEAGSSTHLVFSLPPVSLNAGQYAIVLSFGDGAGPAEMFLQHPDGDTYADGVAISLEGEFWKSDTNGFDAAVTLTFST